MAHAPIDYGLFDADNHYYETRDAFTRFMPASSMHLAIAPRRDAGGRERIYVGDERFTSGRFSEARAMFDRLVNAPVFEEFLTLPAYEALRETMKD